MKKPSWIWYKWIHLTVSVERWLDNLKCNHKDYGYLIEGVSTLSTPEFQITKIKCGRCGKKGYVKVCEENGEKWGAIRFPLKEQEI
jgi:hypothetical protein